MLWKSWFLPVLGILLIEAILFATNFQRGTFLIGWDNVMPEFNLATNLQRTIFSVWQDYRGLGLLDGQAHAANLAHTIYIWLLSLLLPDSALRYVFTHITHLVGGLGLFFLARKLTGNSKASFIGAIFYMLNLGIVQMYYAPLEVFTVHFAALPWLSLLTINALKDTNSKNLLLLFIASLLASPQGFIPTVFIAFLIVFAFLNISFLYKTRQFKTSFIVAFILIAANAFWLLPYSYSSIKTADTIKNSRINQFSSEEIFYRNKAHGNLIDVLTFKGFMIDASELSPREGRSVFLMDSWRNLTSHPLYLFGFIAILATFLFGVKEIVKKRNFEMLPFLLVFLTGFFFLANDTLILSTLNDIFRRVFPLLGEAFRFPFTKFITVFAFAFSIILAFGIASISFKNNLLSRVGPIVILVLIIVLSFPAFRGNFFSSLLKVSVPQEYFQLFKDMQGLPHDQRVALFPVATFWNWEYLGWGNLGSGFQWYGIPQPVLKRSFDPWGRQNEQFYNEISYAVSNQNNLNLLSVLRKYDVKYILLDQNIQNTLTRQPINFDSLKKFLEKQDYLSIKNTYGRVILYEVNFPTSPLSFTKVGQTLSVNPNYRFEKKDNSFMTVGTYVKKSDPDIIPLFPSLFSEKLQDDLDFSVSETNQDITLISKASFPSLKDKYTLEIPSFPQEEFLVPVEIKVNNGELQFHPIYPTVYINDQKITPSDVPIRILPSVVTNPTEITFVDINHKIDMGQSNPRSYLMTSFPNSLVLSDGVNSESITFDTTLTNRSTFYIPIDLDEDIESVKLTTPKFKSSLSYENVLVEKEYKITNPVIDEFRKKGSLAESTKTSEGIMLKAKGTSNELAFYLDNLPHAASYLMTVDNKYISGLPMNFYSDNTYQFKAEAETQLSKINERNYVILPKTEEYFKGYGFHFTVKSLGGETAESILKNVEISPYPAELVRNIRLVKTIKEPIITKYNEKNPLPFEKLNLSTFSIEDELPNDSYLILSQAYDPGWQAYQVDGQTSNLKNNIANFLPFIFGEQLNSHVLINNWENGWEVNSKEGDSRIIITYLPQYFQYLGFGLTIVTFFYLILFAVKSRNRSA